MNFNQSAIGALVAWIVITDKRLVAINEDLSFGLLLLHAARDLIVSRPVDSADCW